MANQKQYSIVINGIESSGKQIDALMKKLDSLEKKLDSLSKGVYNVDTSSLKEVSDIQSQQITNQEEIKAKYDETIVKAQELKNANKEVQSTVKAIADGALNMDGSYTNTLAGMRKQLSDLKKELSGTELGTEQWEKLKDKTNEVNEKVKELEKSYGVFSRDVGHYENALGGFEKIKVKVGETTREFNSVKEATRSFTNEMKNTASRMFELSQAGHQNTEEFRKLQQQFNDTAKAGEQMEKTTAYMQRMYNAATDDSGAIGEVARSMESFVAVAQVGTGIAGLFGADDDTEKAINRTIQVMNVLQGVQKLFNEQLQEGTPLMKLYNALFGSRATATSTATDATSKDTEAVEGNTTALQENSTQARTWSGAIAEVGSRINDLVTRLELLKDELNGLQSKSIVTPEEQARIEELQEEIDLLTVTIEKCKAMQEGMTKLQGEATKQEQASSKAIEENTKVQTKNNVTTKSFSTLIGNLKGNLKQAIVGEKEFTVANVALGVGEGVATIAAKALKAALIAIPFMAIFAAVMALVEGLVNLCSWIADTMDTSKQMEDQIDRINTKFEVLITTLDTLNNLGVKLGIVDELSAANQTLELNKMKLMELAIALQGVADEYTTADKVIAANITAQGGLTQTYWQAEDAAKNVYAQLSSMEGAYASISIKVKQAEADGEELSDALSAEEIAFKNLYEQLLVTAQGYDAVAQARKNALNKMLKEEKNDYDDAVAKYGKNSSQAWAEWQKYIQKALEETKNEYGESSQEYKEMLREQMSADREHTEYIEQQHQRQVQSAQQAAQKRQQAAKQLAKALEDQEKLIAKNKIEMMKDGLQKTIAQLKQEQKEQLKAARERGVKVKEAEESINALYNKKIEDATKKHFDNIGKVWEQYRLKLNNELAQFQENTNQLHIDTLVEMNDGDDSYDKIQKRFARIKEIMMSNMETISQDMSQSIARAFMGSFEELGNNLEGKVDEVNRILEGIDDKDLSNDGIAKEIENINKLFEKFGDVATMNDEEFKVFFKDAQSQMDKFIAKMKGMKGNISLLPDGDELNTVLDNIMTAWEKQMTKLNGLQQQGLQEYGEKFKAMQDTLTNYQITTYKNSLDKINEIVEKNQPHLMTGNSAVDTLGNLSAELALNKKIAGMQESAMTAIQAEIKLEDEKTKTLKEQIEAIEQQLSDLGKLQELMQKQNSGTLSADEYVEFGKLVEKYGVKSLEDVQKLIDELNKKHVKLSVEFSSAETLKKALEDLTDDFKAESLDWKKILTDVATMANETVNIIADVWSNLAEMAYNKEKARIEEEEDQLDDELDMLEEQYDAQEELYQEHNDKINDIESELSSARGDRRTELLANLNNEMAQQEKAWALKQKIQKKEEQLQKRKEQLEKEEEQAEKQKNRANQKIQIMQAVASTALGVAQALGTYTWPYSMIVAAIVGAMGAVEIATIASQKFAEGGVIDGASHAQGGVKVLGGRAEVEGGEYITNKKTTAKNVGVLSYINSQDKTLTLADFEDYFSGKGKYRNSGLGSKVKFAQGGQLGQAPDIDVRKITSQYQQDDRPIVVSVVDIWDAEDNLRTVQALAGLND